MPPKKGLPKQLGPWMELVAEMRRRYPTLEYKELLKKAKPVYASMKRQGAGYGMKINTVNPPSLRRY